MSKNSQPDHSDPTAKPSATSHPVDSGQLSGSGNKEATAGAATTTAKRPQDMTTQERMEALRQYGEKHRTSIVEAEKKASGIIVIPQRTLPFFLIGMLGVLFSLFLPHSGTVYGYDVLLFTDRAREMVTTWPERIYIWLALVGGLLLPVGTIVSRSTVVAWVTWFVSGIAWVYGGFAIWMRQSRPPTEPGAGPSYGLILGFVAVIIIFATVTSIVFHRSVLQRVLAEVRREEADKNDEARAAQQKLRTGIDVTEQHYIPEDTRRARAKARARKVAQGSQDSQNSQSQ